MKSPKFSGKLKKPKLLFRRIVGNSMSPTLNNGQLVVGWPTRRVQVGDVVVVRHNGMEKIKRISKYHGETIYVLGDNLAASTDSRQFGWLSSDHVIAKIIWPKG